MSTIAFDGRIVACDGQATESDGTINPVTPDKLRVVQSCSRFAQIHIVGGCGDLSACLAFENWVERFNCSDTDMASEEAIRSYPVMDRRRNSDGGISIGLWVTMEEGKPVIVREFEDEPFSVNTFVGGPGYAWGSGCQFAIGALRAGVTAVEAVKIACDVDAGSGPPIFVFNPSWLFADPERRAVRLNRDPGEWLRV